MLTNFFLHSRTNLTLSICICLPPVEGRTNNSGPDNWFIQIDCAFVPGLNVRIFPTESQDSTTGEARKWTKSIQPLSSSESSGCCCCWRLLHLLYHSCKGCGSTHWPLQNSILSLTCDFLLSLSHLFHERLLTHVTWFYNIWLSSHFTFLLCMIMISHISINK